MSSLKPLWDETAQIEKQNCVACSNYHDNSTSKEKSIIGTFENPLCLSCDRNALEANAGNVYEELIGESSFGGSFGRAKTVDNCFGGNVRTPVFDDTQVVPDFNDLLETFPIDIDRNSVSTAPFVAESEACTRVHHLENRDSSAGPKRRNSERDELEIYFPCVLTPLPVDRLYSTLVDDSTVFKFPVPSDEFLADDKSKQGLSTSEHGDTNNTISQGSSHSLDSFANRIILSFPGGSEPQLDNKLDVDVTSETWKQQDLSDAWISTRGKDYDSKEERNFFSDSGLPCIIEQQISPHYIVTIENNSSFPEAINFVTKASTCSAKDFTTGQSSEAVYDLNTAPTSQQRMDFTPNLTADNDLSLNPFSLDGWENRCTFDSPVEKPTFIKNEYSEGGETSIERSRSKFSMCNTPENLCKRKSRRAKGLSCSANTSVVKTKATANQEGNDVEYSTSLNTKTRTSKSRSGENEQETFYHGNSRGFHNDMEKQRRINMKTRFQKLRMALPELLDNGKASKIAILQKAMKCIVMLEKESVDLENMKRTERRKNMELLNRLQKITAGKL